MDTSLGLGPLSRFFQRNTTRRRVVLSQSSGESIKLNSLPRYVELDSTSELIHVLDPNQFLSKFLRRYTELAKRHTHAHSLAHARTRTHSLNRESSQRAVHNKGQTDISCILIKGNLAIKKHS